MFLWWPRMDKPNTSAPLVANTGEHEWTGRRDERPSHNKSISILYLSCLHADLSQEWLVQEKCGHIFILWFQNSSQRIRLDHRHPETHLKAPFISRWNSFCSSMLVSYKHKLIRLHSRGKMGKRKVFRTTHTICGAHFQPRVHTLLCLNASLWNVYCNDVMVV